ncbi:MAG TPA: prolyl oligopeptidase family serine peptidase [Bryobacteraceae bacterium]|nr:prolyl oligopeptidase family serine peptidase [Bryobacteraceae bacterium]
MKQLLLVLAGAALTLCSQSAATFHYPLAPKGNQVDDYHGVKIADPYRQLEDADSPATEKWVKEENELTFSYLHKLPGRDAIQKQLTELWNYEKFSDLHKAGGHYFYRHNTGLQNQSVVFVEDSLTGPARELIDPNTYRKDGTAALNGESISWNGKLYAYGVAQAGSDWTDWHVREVATGKDLPDLLHWTKSTTPEWTADDRGFYYSRFPEPSPDKILTAAALNQKIYFHKLGDPQSADQLMYERPDHPAWGLDPILLEGSHYLFFYIYPGVEGTNLLSYQDLSKANPRTVDLITTPQYSYMPIAALGSVLYVQTNDNAPRGKVIAIDLDHPERANWREIVPQREETLQGVQMANDKLLLDYMQDAHSVARLVTLAGKPVSEIALPAIGTANWSPARLHDQEMFYQFESFTIPPSTYRLDLETAKSKLVRRSKVAFDPSGFETKQIFYHSKDGTRVPMFLSYRKGLKLDGENPTLLYGYGGFDIAENPVFRPRIMEWLEMGGIYASANLRGGSEYGEAWHHAGWRQNKQNVFDDFIAAAEWLIANKYTSTPKLAIYGASNGGLLIGAVLNQRPDLFGAAMPAVGVMDMLRFDKFGFGTQWVGEYGRPENPADFKVLIKYSPLQNIRKGVAYPPTLITTADHDDRVMPGHSLKYAATLQQAQAGPAPILIRIETRAGHGAGSPTTKQIDEWTDRFAFLAAALKMHVGS